MNRRKSWLLLMGLCGAMAGCKPSGPATVPVSGTVTWNGTAMLEGNIIFTPEGERGVPEFGRIKDGKYNCPVRPGKKKVEIYAERTGGKPDPVMRSAAREQYLPAKYNTATQLRAEVQAGQENRFGFALTDDPQKGQSKQ